jgi:short-subunit dehydrogenase involved in D-alanine esterification of teichoic acids
VNGSWDQYYACAKGAMHSYFLSLANKVEIHSQIILVVSGLIQNSRMYQQMSPENRQKHLTLSGGFLPNTEDFANFVFELNQTWATQSISPVVWFGNPY